jgi:hypothetical protein
VTAFLPPGTRLGKYELIRSLAVGGMAELHLARVAGIDGFEKIVVLKRILPQLAADAEFVRMFLDEARVSAALHHPNLVQVFDYGEASGSCFFTMEWVRGEDLAAVVSTAARRGEGLSLQNAVTIVVRVAEGLHHAHEARGSDGAPLGLVHRDVSPTNILVTYDGAVKLCDFGIAKAFALQARLTEGVVKGKSAYLSPEQCRGEALDRRSDVFSLGVVLYELTTGKRLFRGASDIEIRRQITDVDVPPPSQRIADYPPALEAIVLRALRRDRAERYATTLDMQLALEDFARDERLVLSSAQLGRWMEGLFPAKARASREQVLAPAPPATATGATAEALALETMKPLPERRRVGRGCRARRRGGRGARRRRGRRLGPGAPRAARGRRRPVRAGAGDDAGGRAASRRARRRRRGARRRHRRRALADSRGARRRGRAGPARGARRGRLRRRPARGLRRRHGVPRHRRLPGHLGRDEAPARPQRAGARVRRRPRRRRALRRAGRRVRGGLARVRRRRQARRAAPGHGGAVRTRRRRHLRRGDLALHRAQRLPRRYAPRSGVPVLRARLVRRTGVLRQGLPHVRRLRRRRVAGTHAHRGGRAGVRRRPGREAGRRPLLSRRALTSPDQRSPYGAGAGGKSTASMMCTTPFDARTEATMFASLMVILPSTTWMVALAPLAMASTCPSLKPSAM